MPTSRPFAYNPTQATISGTTNVGTLCIGVSALNYSGNPGGIKWWMGPDEDNSYIIAKDVPSGNFPTPVGSIGTVQFWGCTNTDEAFRITVQIISGTTQASASEASTWLSSNGYWTNRAGSSVDPDAQAFITAANITDTTQQSAINTLVVGLKTDGIWTKMMAIYPFVGGTASSHKYNLKDPRDLNVAYRLSFAGGWTHSSNGVTPNGVNGYADTYFDGNVGAIGCYNRNTNFAMGTRYDEWEGGDYPVYSIPWIYLLGRSGTIQNTVDQQNIVNPAGASLPFAHITYDTQQRLYTNGNLVNSNAFYTSAPSAPTGYPIWIGGLNDNGRYNSPTYYGGTSSFSFISGTLNSTESANLNTAVQAFQTTLGRQV